MKIIIKTALFVLLFMQVGLTQAIELKEVVAHVVENNPEIKKIHYELESEIQDLFSSQKFPNTSLDLYGGAGGQRNFDYTSINIKDMDKCNGIEKYVKEEWFDKRQFDNFMPIGKALTL